METLEVRDFAGKVTLIVDGAWWKFIRPKDSMGDGNAVIVFTKCRCLVDDTSTVGIGNIGINQNPESFVFELIKGRSLNRLIGTANSTHLLCEIFK